MTESHRVGAPSSLAPMSARHSLRWRLPLHISGLIALVLATFLWFAYRRVESTLVQTAGQRAQRAADQIASLLDGQRSMEQLRRLAVDPALQRLLTAGTPDAREEARSRLSALAGTSSRRIEVWDNAGTRLLDIVVTGTNGASAKLIPSGAAPSAGGIGPLQAFEGAVFTDSVAEIVDDGTSSPSSRRLGFVRIRSTFVESPPGIFSHLVGQDAVIRIANRSGDLWTDLSRVVAPPAVDLTRSGMTEYRSANGTMRVGAASPVAATPWAVWVEFPLATIIAPAQAFLTGMILVALGFVAISAILATALASRITTPLAEINRAAAAIAAGDYSRPVNAERSDEIGQVGRTFNTMAADVKAATDALQNSEARYRQLFAANPHPMWVYDLETLRFLDVNDLAVAHYGYSRDEFLAMTIKDIRPTAELQALLDNISREPQPVERSGLWKHRAKDGRILDVEVSSHELTLDGRRTRVILANDVTERLRAERALRESEALFRGMAETMPQIVWTARPDGQREYYNHRWFAYTGLDVEATRGLGWQLAIHPADRDTTLLVWRRAVTTGAPHGATYRLRRADGTYRWHVGRAAPLVNEGGQIVLWVGTITDIDDARRDHELLQELNAELEQRVRARTADLEAVNRELESFSYSVSHDLRAPLRHVQGYVEMLTASIRGQLSEKSQRYLTTITDATVEMGQLIDDLLAFSRIGRVQMSEGRVSLDDLVQNVIAHLEIATRGRTIRWKIPPLPMVSGDPSMLKQVYVNLIGNAVKYTSQREHAEIEVGCGDEEEGRRVLFVRDNGAGFDMKYAHKLFGVFQRLHRPEEFEGTGIGLATVRRIIARHGGRTWAEGEVNVGATIYFTLQEAPDWSATAS